MAKSKPKTLNLEEKVKVIQKSEKGISSRKIAEEMGVGRTQIQCIIKRKA
jgi:transcriptional regulator